MSRLEDLKICGGSGDVKAMNISRPESNVEDQSTIKGGTEGVVITEKGGTSGRVGKVSWGKKWGRERVGREGTLTLQSKA